MSPGDAPEVPARGNEAPPGGSGGGDAGPGVGDGALPHREESKPSLSTGQEYLTWVRYLFNSGLDFAPLGEAFPEVSRQSRVFDTSVATVYYGQATVFACKLADGLSYAQVVWHLNHLLGLIPRPSAIDAVGYYGALVLVFERGLDPVKRDRLVKLQKRRWLRGGFVQIILIDLPAKATWTLGIPKTIQLLLWPLEDAMTRKGEPPALKPVPRRLGHTGWKAPLNYMTIALVGVLALVHVVIFVSSPQDSIDLRLFRAGARHTRAILDGEVWRLMTPIFLHAGWGHLIGNLAGLFEFGRLAEPLFGGGWLLAFFVMTGLAATIFSIVISPGPMSIGASGCLYGLFGVAAGVFAFRKKRMTFRFQGHFFRLLRVFIVLNVFNFILGWLFGSNIDHLAHLGGFIAGFIFGVALPFQENERMHFFGKWIGVVAIIAGLIGGVAVLERRDAAVQPFMPLRDEYLRVCVERPIGFRSQRSQDNKNLTLDNGIHGKVKISRMKESYVWMFERGAQAVERNLKARWEGVEVEEVSETRLGKLRAMRIRYCQRPEEGPAWAFEDLYIPQAAGTLYMQLSSLESDAPYYQSIYSRIKTSLISLMPPAGNLPQ